jgi:hypothetical protein
VPAITPKPSQHVGIDSRLLENFQRHIAFEIDIAGAIDHRHTTASDLFQQLKMPKRAEKAEGYAIAAIEFAAAATAEAELATLEAIVARMESEDARAIAS